MKLATPQSFMHTMLATELPFVVVPGLPSSKPSTSVKLPGVDGLRVDLLVHGKTVGGIVRVPKLQWAAQAIPFCDYLLTEPEQAAMLAGGHCIPLRLPQAARMMWHKLYSSIRRRGSPEKATKDRDQALMLGAAVASDDSRGLIKAGRALPDDMRRTITSQAKSLFKRAAVYPELEEVLQTVLR